MKHLILLIAVVVSTVSFSTIPNPAPRPDTKVYVCVSNTSTRYHTSSSCSGLTKCTHEIKGMSIAEAQKMGKTPCHICNPPAK